MKPAEEALWQAISDGDLTLIRVQWAIFDRPQDHYVKVNDYPSFNATNPEDGGKSFFIHALALECPNKAVVDYLLQNLPLEALLLCDADKESSLLYAAAAGYTHVIEKLLKESVPIDTFGNPGRTALSYAADYGQEEVVACLLDRKAKPNQADIDGIRPLHYACQGSYYGIAERLLAAGAAPFYRTNDGESVFDKILDNNANLIFLLLQYSAGINATLPKMPDGLSLTVIEFIKTSKDTIFMIGCENADIFHKSPAIFDYDITKTIKFSSMQQRKTLLEHCHYLLRQRSLQKNIRREIAILSQRLHITDLQYIVADVLRQYDTKEKVKGFVKQHNQAGLIRHMPLHFFTDQIFGLQLLGEMLHELGYLPNFKKTVVAPPPQLSVVFITKDREPTEREDAVVTINRKRGLNTEISNLDNIIRQLENFITDVTKHRDNWLWGNFNDTTRQNIVVYCRQCYRKPPIIIFTPLLILIPAIAVCAYFYHIAPDGDGNGARLLLAGLVILSAFTPILSLMLWAALPDAKECWHTINSTLEASRTELIEYLREIEKNSTHELPNLRHTITAITATNNNRHGVLLPALDQVKTFFNAEKVRVEQDPKSLTGFRYFAAITFYQSSKEKSKSPMKDFDERSALLRLDTLTQYGATLDV